MELREKIHRFKSYSNNILIGAIGGLISGIFFSVYNDLKTQTENIYLLLGGSLLTTTVWFFIILIILFLIFLGVDGS